MKCQHSLVNDLDDSHAVYLRKGVIYDVKVQALLSNAGTATDPELYVLLRPCILAERWIVFYLISRVGCGRPIRPGS